MLACLVALGCTGKAPEYPDLEGYWKEEYIENGITGERTECNRQFWALQLGVSEVLDFGGNGYGSYLCLYEYNEGAGTLRMYKFRVKGNQTKEADVEKLKYFGIPAEDAEEGVTFEVVKLDGDDMILRSDETTLYFSSF